jgi:hypothetical protein
MNDTTDQVLREKGLRELAGKPRGDAILRHVAMLERMVSESRQHEGLLRSALIGIREGTFSESSAAEHAAWALREIPAGHPPWKPRTAARAMLFEAGWAPVDSQGSMWSRYGRASVTFASALLTTITEAG